MPRQLNDNICPFVFTANCSISSIGNLSAKELKKLRSKKRRAEKKAQAQEEDKKGVNCLLFHHLSVMAFFFINFVHFFY